jgi:hypothetical protein
MKWSWKNRSDIIIFTFIGICFGINALINNHYDDNIYTNNEIISLILILFGYIFLFVYNYKKKWIFGLIIVSILLSICMYRLCKMYYYIK